jgi:hypothetical protein
MSRRFVTSLLALSNPPSSSSCSNKNAFICSKISLAQAIHFVGAPIFAHLVASAFHKMIEPKGRAGVSGKALILSLLITQSSRRSIGFSGGATTIRES